ncbi:MAG: CvpA family protein [Dehalococcoidales bacterium]|jgi:membrane protein required for colicin V production
MNWLDILILVSLAASVIGGLATGFVRGAVNLAGLILGIVLAGRFYETLGGRISFIHNTDIANAVAFVVIIVVAMILAGLVGGLLRKIISGIMLGWLDHLLGAVLGLFIGAVSLGALLVLWVKFSPGSAGVVSSSVLAKILLDNFPLVLNLLPSSFDSVKNFFA